MLDFLCIDSSNPKCKLREGMNELSSLATSGAACKVGETAGLVGGRLRWSTRVIGLHRM